jgi:hypothetical protein
VPNFWGQIEKVYLNCPKISPTSPIPHTLLNQRENAHKNNIRTSWEHVGVF